MIDAAIDELYDNAEKLLRRADEAILSAPTTLTRKRATRQRNAINAACNALWRAKKA